MNKINVNISAPNLASICLDKADTPCYKGRFYHKYRIEPEEFNNAGHLLQLIDRLCDISGYPQSSTKSRSFHDIEESAIRKEAEPVADSDMILNQKGDLATFVVHVKQRQHSTWQGEVVWAEKNKKKTFRSALELLKLFDGALDDEEEIEEGRA